MGLPTEPMLMERTSPPRARVGLLLLGRLLLLLLLPDRLLVLVLRRKLGRAMRVDLTSASSPPRGEASEELESPDAAGLSAVAAGAAAAAVPAAVDPERRQSHPSARLKSADGLVGE